MQEQTPHDARQNALERSRFRKKQNVIHSESIKIITHLLKTLFFHQVNHLPSYDASRWESST